MLCVRLHILWSLFKKKGGHALRNNQFNKDVWYLLLQVSSLDSLWFVFTCNCHLIMKRLTWWHTSGPWGSDTVCVRCLTGMSPLSLTVAQLMMSDVVYCVFILKNPRSKQHIFSSQNGKYQISLLFVTAFLGTKTPLSVACLVVVKCKSASCKSLLSPQEGGGELGPGFSGVFTQMTRSQSKSRVLNVQQEVDKTPSVFKCFKCETHQECRLLQEMSMFCRLYLAFCWFYRFLQTFLGEGHSCVDQCLLLHLRIVSPRFHHQIHMFSLLKWIKVPHVRLRSKVSPQS